MLPTTKTPPKQDLADISLLLYSQPKFGKSTWCSQADGALFLATEAGLNHLETYQVPIATWDDLLNACADIARGEHPFRTVIIDTIDNAFRLCTEHVCAQLGVRHESELPFGRAYGQIANEFTRVITKLSMLPYGLYLVSHAKQETVETRTGNIVRTVPTLPEKARKIVLGLVDLILYLDMEPYRGEDGDTQYRRVIRTKPTANYEAGDRTGKLPETLPLDYQAFVDAFTTDPFQNQ
jgi:hypothetical protein